MPGEDICSIVNVHVEECGKPPEIDFEDYSYVSYFENVHGDQSFFLYDSDVNEVIVYLADAGWENPQKLPARWILDNTVLPDDADIGILPDSSEKTWLKACKSAVQPRIADNLSQTNS